MKIFKTLIFTLLCGAVLAQNPSLQFGSIVPAPFEEGGTGIAQFAFINANSPILLSSNIKVNVSLLNTASTVGDISGAGAAFFTWDSIAPTLFQGTQNQDIPEDAAGFITFVVDVTGAVDDPAGFNANLANVSGLPGNITDDDDEGVTAPIVAALPVEITAFDINNTDCASVSMTWETAQEKNNKGFYIERSAKSSDRFETVAFMEGNGNSSGRSTYVFKDDISNIKGGAETIYYRLKQVDFDGRFEYSDIIRAKVECDETIVISGYPNPVINDYNLNITGKAGTSKVLVMNDKNQLIESFSVIRNSTKVISMQQYQSGVYTLSVLDADGQLIDTKKVIKISN